MQDGDSITLLVPDGASYKQVKVRLGEIDTPESNGQPFGEGVWGSMERYAELGITFH